MFADNELLLQMAHMVNFSILMQSENLPRTLYINPHANYRKLILIAS